MASGLQGRLMSILYWLRLTLWIFLSPPPPSPLSPHHHTSPENESFGSDSVRCEIWEIPKNEVLRYFCSVSLSLWSFPLRLFCLDCSKNECSQHTDQPCSPSLTPTNLLQALKAGGMWAWDQGYVLFPVSMWRGLPSAIISHTCTLSSKYGTFWLNSEHKFTGMTYLSLFLF